MQFMGISLFSIMFAGDGIYLQSTGFWFFVLLFLFLLLVSQSSQDKLRLACQPTQPASTASCLISKKTEIYLCSLQTLPPTNLPSVPAIHTGIRCILKNVIFLLDLKDGFCANYFLSYIL